MLCGVHSCSKFYTLLTDFSNPDIQLCLFCLQREWNLFEKISSWKSNLWLEGKKVIFKMLVGNAISSNLRSLIFKIFRGSMPPDPPRRTKISVRRFAAIRNFCILLGTHSKFGLDPRLAMYWELKNIHKAHVQYKRIHIWTITVSTALYRCF